MAEHARMWSSCTLMIVLVSCALLAPAAVRCQGSEGDEGSEGTDVGANPPNALIGCNSPYTYLEANSRGGLETLHSLVEGDPDVKAAMKYRNFTGTLLMPTDSAFEALAQTHGIRVLEPGTLTTAFLQSLIEYHVLLDPLDPTTLASQQGEQPYDTAFTLNAQGANAKLAAPAWQLFTRDQSLTYESVTIDVAAIAAGTSADQAPLGTYTVTAGASSANIIWTADNAPTRTCLAYVYLIDTVLLPSNDTSSLSAGGAPTTSLVEAGESEGGSVEAPLAAAG